MGIFILYNIYIKNNMRKIIITESQANMLKTHLFESTFGTFLRNVRPNDIINIKMTGQDIEYKVIRLIRNRPVMDLILQGNQVHDKLYYFRSFSSSLSGNDSIVFGIADRRSNINNLNNAVRWPTRIIRNIESIELLRNGTVIDNVDMTPLQQQSQSNTGSTQSNTGSTGTTATTVTISQEDILKNPYLKKAFYEPDSPLKAFLKGLIGKKLTGKGIIVAKQKLDKFYLSDYGSRLGNSQFIEGKMIKFNPDNDTTIFYNISGTTSTSTGATSSYTFNETTEYTSNVARRQIGDMFKIIGSIRQGSLFYKIKIIKKEDSLGDDVFKGEIDLFSGTFTRNIRLNIVGNKTIYIKIIRGASNSPGYNPQQSQSTP